MTTAGECQNCGAAVSGRYCSACGQKVDVRIPTLLQLLGDAFADLFNFDSRMWRSLGTLMLRPGRLTCLYLQGQRARFTPPFRMYLVASVAFFLAFGLVRAATRSDEAPAAAQAAPLPAEVVASAAAPPGAEAQQQVTLGITIDDDDVECELGAASVDEALRERLEAACRRVEQGGAERFNREFADNFPLTMLV